VLRVVAALGLKRRWFRRARDRLRRRREPALQGADLARRMNAERGPALRAAHLHPRHRQPTFVEVVRSRTRRALNLDHDLVRCAWRRAPSTPNRGGEGITRGAERPRITSGFRLW
jgi:hypothetical protein